MGQVIGSRRLEIASHTTVAMRGQQAIANLLKPRSFLGLRNASRRFAQNFARIATPLKKKLRKEQSTVSGLLNEEILSP